MHQIQNWALKVIYMLYLQTIWLHEQSFQLHLSYLIFLHTLCYTVVDKCAFVDVVIIFVWEFSAKRWQIASKFSFEAVPMAWYELK